MNLSRKNRFSMLAMVFLMTFSSLNAKSSKQEDKYSFEYFLSKYCKDQREFSKELAEQFVTLQEDTSNTNIPKKVNFNYGTTYYIWPFMFNSSSKKNIFPDAQTGKPTRYGTLKGIEEKLNYFTDLGVKNLMIAPFTKCWEGGMDLYNINRYQTIDWTIPQPQLGTAKDVHSLCKKAHEKDLKVLEDITFNHCSYQHPFWLKALGFKGSKNQQAKYRKWFIFESFSPDGSINNDPFNPNGPYAAYVQDLLINKYGIPNALFNTNTNSNLEPGYYNVDGFAWTDMPYFFMQLTDNPSLANTLKSNLVPKGSDLVGKWVLIFPSGGNLIAFSWLDYPQDMFDYFVNVMKYWLSLGIDGFRWDVGQYMYSAAHTGYADQLFQKITKKLIEFKPNCIMFAEAYNPFYGPYTIGAQGGAFLELARSATGQNMVDDLIYQYQNYWNKTVTMPMLGNHDLGRILSIYQYLPPDYNPYTDLTVAERELRNVSFFTILLGAPGSPMIYYGEELAEIGSTFAQNRDYFKWSQEQYNNGICDTYNYNNIYPQQTRGNGLINPNDPSDTTTPLNYPITRGLDQQIIDYNSSYNLVKKLLDIRNKNSILQKGEMLIIDEELANTINLEVTNASPDIVQFARKYGTALAFVITNQDPNNTGNVATITFDSSYHDPVYNRSYMVNVLFTNGTVLTDAQTAPTSPQNKIRLAPWESLVISYANNPSANW